LSDHKAFFNSLLFLAGYFLLLAFNAFLLRHLSLAAYGDYKIFESLLIVLAPALLLGGKQAAGIFLPPYLKSQKAAKIFGLIAFFIVIGMILVLLALLLSLVMQGVVAHTFNEHIVLLDFLFIFPLAAIAFFLLQTLNVLGRPHTAGVMLNIGIPVFLFVALAVCVFFRESSLTLRDVYIAYSALMCFIIICSLGLIIFRLPLQLEKLHATPKKWLQISIPVAISMTFSHVIIQQDLILMEILGHHEDQVGILGGYLTLAAIIWSIFSAQCFWFLPQFSLAIKNKNWSLVQQQVKRFNALVLVFGGVVALLFVLFAPKILAFFHPGFTAHTDLFISLVIVYFIAAPMSTANIILMLDKRKKLLLSLNLSVFFTIMLLEVILIPRFDIVGAVIPLLIGRLALSVVAVYFCRRDYGLRFFAGKVV